MKEPVSQYSVFKSAPVILLNVRSVSAFIFQGSGITTQIGRKNINGGYGPKAETERIYPRNVNWYSFKALSDNYDGMGRLR